MFSPVDIKNFNCYSIIKITDRSFADRMNGGDRPAKRQYEHSARESFDQPIAFFCTDIRKNCGFIRQNDGSWRKYFVHRGQNIRHQGQNVRKLARQTCPIHPGSLSTLAECKASLAKCKAAKRPPSRTPAADLAGRADPKEPGSLREGPRGSQEERAGESGSFRGQDKRAPGSLIQELESFNRRLSRGNDCLGILWQLSVMQSWRKLLYLWQGT